MIEIWKPVPDAEGYQVSDRGRVRCGRTRKGHPLPEGEWRICDLTVGQKGKNKGYVKVGIEGKTWWVHRLVAAVHLPPPADPKAIVDHKNRDRTCNDADNLQWLSWAENNRKTILQGQGNTQRLSPCEVREIKRRLHQGERGVDIQKIFPQATVGMISSIRTGRTWHYIDAD